MKQPVPVDLQCYLHKTKICQPKLPYKSPGSGKNTLLIIAHEAENYLISGNRQNDRLAMPLFQSIFYRFIFIIIQIFIYRSTI